MSIRIVINAIVILAIISAVYYYVVEVPNKLEAIKNKEITRTATSKALKDVAKKEVFKTNSVLRDLYEDDNFIDCNSCDTRL